MTCSAQKIASALEQAIAGGYAPAKVSAAAFRIYQDHCLEISDGLDHHLMALIAMDEGPEFEMTEVEFLEMLAEIKSTDG